MFKENYNVIGVMSGTSLDGVDLAYISFQKEYSWNFQILKYETVSYTSDWVEKLKNAIYLSKNDLKGINEEYTDLLCNYISQFIAKNAIVHIDAVCSHGHTILHQPDKGYTLQIGNLPKIASLINLPVVCDFRVQDVTLGGQGAPLVPIGDQLLFSEFDYCLNLGGFSNISFENEGKRIAYDISPVNTVLNFYSKKMGFDYDDKGLFAKKGILNIDLFEKLNMLSFYNESYPKSLGMEFVNEIIFPLLDKFKIPNEDMLRTFVEHIAYQISVSLSNEDKTLLITGGGAYNDFLIERMKYYLPKTVLVIPNDAIIQYKEALIFAFLGVLKLRNEINVLASVTGAKKDHSAGVIYFN
ncbi:anhydro-N-acetylmuramic acid kinase [Flavobacterium jejuense]|uniref:Anhydro-N-acetylmuramic acid kinase n=1 Tax=Flavobacterium jejuense TaxID=1544455 RepID=A0ABX0ITS9_9FLAO|nr:anhydro-N-acetylmuramic acid kinase [Flavobacterium jejuense]NHN27299.1 anhydro-N-acetylmuramic acid kinase [Flavobacterium jejuense]